MNPTQRSTNTRWACGFTLVELLVVVAIIAVLISILLPALSVARRQARILVCQTHLRQVATAGTMYLDDHDGSFLQGVNTNLNFGGQQGARGREYGNRVFPPRPPVPKPFNQYLGLPVVVGKITAGFRENASRHKENAAPMFACPDDRGFDDVLPQNYHQYGTSFQTNYYLIGQDAFTPRKADRDYDALLAMNALLPNLNISRVDMSPALVILVGDYGWWRDIDFSNPDKIDWHQRPGVQNLAFLDGHVAATRLEESKRLGKDYAMIPFKSIAAMIDH